MDKFEQEYEARLAVMRAEMDKRKPAVMTKCWADGLTYSEALGVGKLTNTLFTREEYADFCKKMREQFDKEWRAS